MFDFEFKTSFSTHAGGAVAPSTDFIIRVKTDNAGTSASNQFTLPTLASGYDYNVTTSEQTLTNQTGNVTLEWATAGTYEVRISGTFPRIHFDNGGDKLKLIETINFGDVGWTSFGDGNGGAFNGCANNVINPSCTGDFTGVLNAKNAWSGNVNLGYFPAIDMPICTDITGAWKDCQLPDFPLIDLNSVTNAGDFNNGAWQNNRFTSFPAINMPNCSVFRSTWLDCDLTSFPVVNLGTNKTNVQFYGTWRNNNFDSFPALDLSGGTNFGGFNLGSWQGCGVIADFQTRNFYGMTNGQNCFKGTTLSTADYSDILITQRANNANTGVNFHGGNSKYNTVGGVARGELVSIQSWTITDGGAE